MMKPTILLIALLLLTACAGEQRRSESKPKEKPKEITVVLQPLNGFSKTEASNIMKRMCGFLDAHSYPIKMSIGENVALPDSFIYRPRNRYRAMAIIKMLSHQHQPDTITMGLLRQDISVTAHGQYDYGVMGYSFCPGRGGVVSTFRIRTLEARFKTVLHEMFHTLGVPHCPNDAPTCIMQDAHGKDTFYKKHDLCETCKQTLVARL